MTTTDALTALRAERSLHADAGRAVEVQRVDQEITAHLALSRLYADQAELNLAGETEAATALEPQIAFWQRQMSPVASAGGGRTTAVRRPGRKP